VGGSGGLWLTTLYRLTSRRSSLELERNNGARTRLAEEYPAACRAPEVFPSLTGRVADGLVSKTEKAAKILASAAGFE